MKLTAMRTQFKDWCVRWGRMLASSSSRKGQWQDMAWVRTVRHAWLRLPRLHQRLLMVLFPLVLVLSLLPAPSSTETTAQPQERRSVAIDTQAQPKRSATSTDSSQPEASQPSTPENDWVSHQIEQGDTLAKVFRDNDLALTDLYAIANIEGEGKPISRIQPGQWVRFKRTDSGALDILQVETQAGQSVLYFRLSDGGFARQR
ncbi:LysM-like peptidoglycan-binding domain-containing protein [Salinivibrio sp. IB872]|uniref:LysM-like peptidoglycan-binding domain-containing protein n=1 Tax=Salinivibrio sp. IB872 TaxID=1766123 RepID=UPI0018E3E17A|nr:LysM-like peptidoglycan-binding domain-containing protein [Salinivibrio sp. IB872]